MDSEQVSGTSTPLRARIERRLAVGRHHVVLRSIDADNIGELRMVNSSVLPIAYNDAFYADVWNKHPVELSCLAYLNGQAVGGISCRREVSAETPDGPKDRIYIMTLCVLPAYRRLNIGSMLLQCIIETFVADPTYEYMCLHVQTSNEQALRFYGKNGFYIYSRVDGYYRLNVGVEPPHAFFLRRELR
ncbi:acyl-CoA N-acyltransferase [Entophlyctis helioformis]|nr:acyl-CoA N-acyltransferase [Entophlyctis helioformis]